MLHLFFHDLHPPAVALDADLEFVLRVTFGSDSGHGARPSSGDGALRRAKQLGLVQRLARRIPVVAQQALGAAPAHELELAKQQSTTDARARAEVQQRLYDALQSSGVEVALIRQAAIDCTGDGEVLNCNTDVHLLLRDSDVQGLTIALIGAGCTTQLRQVPQASASSARAVFLGHQGAAIVLHTRLRYLRMVPGGVFIDLDCLKRCGQLSRDDATPKNLWLPSRAVQAAEWTAQALVERRFSCEYKAIAALLDGQRLGLASDEDLAFDAYLMLQTDVEHAEFEAMRELLRKLTEGSLSGLSKRARTLLDHAIAAATSPAYRARLRLQRKAQVWQHEGHLERAAERVGELLRKLSMH